MVQFSERMVPEVVQVFWAAIARGEFIAFSEREELALGRAGGESMRAIARRLGRSPSTISRELSRNGDRAGCYRATAAHAQA